MPLVLQNLLYEPSITKNLIRVSHISHDKNVYFMFTYNHCLINSMATNDVILERCLRSDALYEFPNILITNPKYTCFNDNFVSSNNTSFLSLILLIQLLYLVYLITLSTCCILG